VEDYVDPEVNAIHQDLITTYKALGWYYQDAKV
jgi:hypothetical protein